jgi:hypothetical protein
MSNTETTTLSHRDPQIQLLARALAAPFDPKDVKFKPKVVKANRCLAMAYIDARVIQDRLDEVLGVESWQDHYEFLPDGSVICQLRLKLGDHWISKSDVGSPSEQTDSGDRVKAAVSDALKRAAVKFGIGRYLYRLPAEWVEYDPVSKQIVQTPQLPAFARPQNRFNTQTQAQVEQPAPKNLSLPPARKVLPTTGLDFYRRLMEYDAKLAEARLCTPGQLIEHVTQQGVKAGYQRDLQSWTGPAIAFAVEVVRSFERDARSKTIHNQEQAA